jgi:hypothetical protein
LKNKKRPKAQRAFHSFSFVIFFFVMKRERDILLRQRTEEEIDARLRRELNANVERTERAERVAQLSQAQASSLTYKIDKCIERGISIASEFIVAEPVPMPLGMTSIHKFSSTCPHVPAFRRALSCVNF